MILTDLSNTVKKLWEKILFHKQFNKADYIYKLSTYLFT